MNQLTQLATVLPVLPELVLGLGAILMLMVGVSIYQSPRSAGIVNAWCIVILVAAGVCVLSIPAGRYELFGGSFLVDDFARYLKLLAIVGSAGALTLSLDYLTIDKQQKFEYGVLFLLSTLGMLMLISAADLIALYLGLELMSLPLYVVAGLQPRQCALDRGGAEVFRTRRAVVRHAALRRFAHLWL